MGVKEAVRILVLRRLVDDKVALSILEMALLKNMSPSDISRALGVKKSYVKSNVYVFVKAAGDHVRAADLLRKALPIVMGIDPVVFGAPGRMYRCRLCLKDFTVNLRDSQSRMNHVKQSHRDVVEKYINSVVNAISRV
jgi:transposase-like protein